MSVLDYMMIDLDLARMSWNPVPMKTVCWRGGVGQVLGNKGQPRAHFMPF